MGNIRKHAVYLLFISSTLRCIEKCTQCKMYLYVTIFNSIVPYRGLFYSFNSTVRNNELEYKHKLTKT